MIHIRRPLFGGGGGIRQKLEVIGRRGMGGGLASVLDCQSCIFY